MQAGSPVVVCSRYAPPCVRGVCKLAAARVVGWVSSDRLVLLARWVLSLFFRTGGFIAARSVSAALMSVELLIKKICMRNVRVMHCFGRLCIV